MHLLSFATGFAENKVFHLGQMMKQEDMPSFVAAMDKEMAGHNNRRY